MKRKTSFPRKRHSRRDAFAKSQQHSQDMPSTSRKHRKHHDWLEAEEIWVAEADDQR